VEEEEGGWERGLAFGDGSHVSESEHGGVESIGWRREESVEGNSSRTEAQKSKHASIGVTYVEGLCTCPGVEAGPQFLNWQRAPTPAKTARFLSQECEGLGSRRGGVHIDRQPQTKDPFVLIDFYSHAWQQIQGDSDHCFPPGSEKQQHLERLICPWVVEKRPWEVETRVYFFSFLRSAISCSFLARASWSFLICSASYRFNTETTSIVNVSSMRVDGIYEGWRQKTRKPAE
jgi:hypothetical protein